MAILTKGNVMEQIFIKSKFNGWVTITKAKALEYTRWKIHAITMGKNDEERLAIINKQFIGIQFALSSCFGRAFVSSDALK